MLKYEKIFMIFDSIAELKRYWDKNIIELPRIHKNEMLKIVDPELLVQIFFTEQDKKDTSNIANAGLYNKKDFIAMIYWLCGNNTPAMTADEVFTYKNQIKELKEEKNTLLKQNKILKSDNKAVSYLSNSSDKINFEKKVQYIEKINKTISELRKEEVGKYTDVEGMNHIDYISHTASKLLGTVHNDEFRRRLSELSIIMEE